jgi:hypothetical protein
MNIYLSSILKIKNLFFIASCLFIFGTLTPTHAQNGAFNTFYWVTTGDDEAFKANRKINFPIQGAIGLKSRYETNNLSASLSFSFNKNQEISSDNSYLDFKIKNGVIGIGKISRNWSFSPNTSLFLSHNARPAKSIYLNLNSPINSYLQLPRISKNWSFEIYNSLPNNTNGPKNAMMLGMRATINPIKNLDIELLKISQWGGKEYQNDLSSLVSAVIGNSNDGPNANINQVAGLGYSYLLSLNNSSIRNYGQVLGEDEAGNLPSCLIYMMGVELKNLHSKFEPTFGLELIDTRVGYTTNGYCGPNTAYNNNTYQYTNYEKVMGTSIDTEGKSIHIWNTTQISKELTINLSIKNILINDNSWVNHRLSSTRSNGLSQSLSVNWHEKDLNLTATIHNHNIDLDRYNKGLGFKISLSNTF